MPNHEAAGAQKKPRENVWGQEHEGDRPLSQMPDYKIIPSGPAANDAMPRPAAVLKTPEQVNIEADDAVITELLDGAEFEIADARETSTNNLADADPMSLTSPKQVETISRINESDRLTNLGRVEHRNGVIGTPTEAGEVPGSIRNANVIPLHQNQPPTTTDSKVSATEYFGTPKSWTKPSTLAERPPLKEKPFYKRWLGL